MPCLQQMRLLEITPGEVSEFHISSMYGTVKHKEMFSKIINISEYLNLGFICHHVTMEIFKKKRSNLWTKL